MPKFASTCQRRFHAAALLTLALLFALALTASAQDNSVYISIRHYEGIHSTDFEEIERLTRAAFLPIISDSDGFIGYFGMSDVEAGALVSISLFETQEQAIASNELAGSYVAENLAPLLPNPPRIIEGAVHTGGLGLLADPSRLQASLRIYDGFQADNLAAFVNTIEEGLLPLLIETDGFFSYSLMDDGAGTLAALSIYDSEASALASNEKARDFVAENLAAFLPNAPSIISGRVGIAVLASLNDGANLIEDGPLDETVFASVRVYDGVEPTAQGEIARLTNAGFLPILRESDGFAGYFLLSANDTLIAVSHFESAEQAAASNLAARDFVAENLAPLLPNSPLIFEGPLTINHVAALGAAGEPGAIDELYASVRFYDGFDLAHFDEANALAIAQLLPALQELAGFFALFALNDGEDTVLAISIFDGEEAALAANDVGKAFTMEYLADWAPNPPTGATGKIAIAALAERNMGENLVGALLEG